MVELERLTEEQLIHADLYNRITDVVKHRKVGRVLYAGPTGLRTFSYFTMPEYYRIEQTFAYVIEDDMVSAEDVVAGTKILKVTW